MSARILPNILKPYRYSFLWI